MTRRIVIKIGGATLFHPSGFQASLQKVLTEFRNDQVWMLVGGGDLVEAMRSVHRHYPNLDQAEIHWRCIELLDHTWAIAKELLPSPRSISESNELQAAATEELHAGVLWVRVQAFYRRSTQIALPHEWRPSQDWNTTTDTLAWLLGKLIDADLTILLKQCGCDPKMSLREAARLGIVDTSLAELCEKNDGGQPRVQLRQVTTAD